MLAHLSCLKKCSGHLTTVDGRPIDVWELDNALSYAHVGEWAAMFRQNYCLDSEVDALRDGTGLTRAEYLNQLVFPDRSAPPGPAIRAGDFAELIVSDYVEHLLGYWVPRGKYAAKASRNESVKGVDILGFHLSAPPAALPTDVLVAFEVKAQLSGEHYSGRLQAAIDDSSNDYLRRAMTLNATKQRLHRAGQTESALVVQRFQNLADHPYLFRSGAAAVLSDSAYDEALLKENTDASKHNNSPHLELLVIRGTQLMHLVHHLYKRAADEA